MNVPYLMKKAAEAGEKGAKRSSKSTGDIGSLWKALGALSRKRNLFDLIKAAQQRHWGGAKPLDFPANISFETKADPLPCCGVDGSQIYPNDHEPRWAFVHALAKKIGHNPHELYRSEFFDSDDLILGSGYPAEKHMVDSLRTVIELETLSAACDAWPGGLALLDGPLLPFFKGDGMGIGPETKECLRQYTETLKNMKGKLIAGIVSSPESYLLMNLFYLLSTEDPAANAPRTGVKDIHLLRHGLEIGKRSGLFMQASPRNELMIESGFWIGFFFVKTRKTEVLRVEIPSWVANDRKMIEAIHASLLVGNIRGYPYLLAAADNDVRIKIDLAESLKAISMKNFLDNGGRPYHKSTKQTIKDAAYK